MPCPQRLSAALRETETTDNGVTMYTWRAVRRQHLRMLRKSVRQVVIFMALLEILRVGVVDMVYAGRHDTKAPGPEDYGIAYNVGYVIGWLYMCLFAIIYVPFFSWWVPQVFFSSGPNSTDDDPSKPSEGRCMKFLQQVNAILLPTCIAVSLATHVYYVVSAFIFVDGKPVDPSVKNPRNLNSRRNWLVRLLLLSGIMIVTSIGKAAFIILEQMDLARVKPLEYVLIVLPIQVNLGILLGSAMQFNAEQRRNRKIAAQQDKDAEAATADEKQGLLISV